MKQKVAEKTDEKDKSVFDLLNPKIAELAKERFGKPTIVQELAIPKILDGKSILTIAGTGFGKTESVMLPVLSRLLDGEHKPISALYITPMKSLNRDLLDRLIWWCNKLELEISVRHGDTIQYERKKQSEFPPSILITTPETLQILLVSKNFRNHLANVEYVVVDELHELVESKRGAQLTIGLERLKRLIDEGWNRKDKSLQIIALSATVGSPDLAKKFVGCGEVVKAITSKDLQLTVESPVSGIEHKKIAEKAFIGEDVAAKLSRILELIKSYRSTLIFTNTRESAEILSSRLRVLDSELAHDVHHSSLSKDVRIKAEKDFKEEKLKALIATSSLELGIDIGSIDLVVQYMSPRQVSKLTQRVGRSGHGIGRKSEGIIISGEGDDVFESAVIARKTLAGELEELQQQTCALDVLANQIIGFAMGEYGVDSKKVFEAIKKSHQFSNLTQSEFDSVLKFLVDTGLIWLNGTEVRRRRKAFDYYFENLSMIPDSHQYKVIDTALNQAVGSVDEQFMATHESGTNFIVKGRAWRILSVEGDKIFVEATDDITSAIPAWEGELIPIPFAIAQEVYELRNGIGEQIKRGLGVSKITDIVKNRKSVSEISSVLMKKYPVSDEAAAKMISLVERQLKKYGLPEPFTLEKHISEKGEFVVMHSCFGTKVNETLARFVSTILSAKYGSAVAVKVDPYRILFKGCKAEDVKAALLEHKPDDIETLLSLSLPRTSLFKWRFIFVAKRFGAISKSAKYDKIRVDKIVDLYSGSPIHTETLRELFLEKLDLQRAKELMRKLQAGDFKIKEIEGLSPIAEIGFRYELSDVAKPERPEAEILKIFKQRLLDTKLRLVCMNCGKYSVAKSVSDIEDKPRCLSCGSRLIAIAKEHHLMLQEVIKKHLKGKPLTAEEQKQIERVKWTAELVLTSGREAVLCLAGRGVGADTATRILAKPHRTEDDLFKLILEAERNFIKTKRFWS